MGFLAEKLRVIHDGTTQLDSRARTGLVLVSGMATNFVIAATVQPAEVALGSIVLISTATIVEGRHQGENMEIRDSLTDTLEPDEAKKLRDTKARSEFQEG